MNQQSLDNATKLHDDLWSIGNLLSPEEFQELLFKIQQENSWEKVNLQEYKNREQVTWKTDGVCDWLFCKISELDFSRFDLSFRTVMIWRDRAGYTIANHYDNDRVTAAMQIYLSASHPGLGTWFLDTIEIPFVQNTGYIMHNRNRLTHGMKTVVPDGYTRLSLYALFDEKKR